MPEKKFSVIIPTFNSQKYITECITSVLAQSYQNFEIIIIDNNSKSAEGRATRDHANKIGARYFPETNWRSTATRDLVFRKAQGEFVLCLDPHVLIEPDTIKRILKFIENNPTTKDLYGGVMVYDSFKGVGCTNMKPIWRSQMFGIWEHQQKGANRDDEPFEIPLHGLGLFMQKKDAWQGFNPLFLGFGGEEGYIHEKTRRAGSRNICLPWLRWNHRFTRPRGVVYSLNIKERISNYFIGWKENQKEVKEIYNHFETTNRGLDLKAIEQEVDILLGMDLKDAISKRRSS